MYRVDAEHMLSLDDGYCTAGCLRGKIFMNQVNAHELFAKTLITITDLDDVWKVLKSWIGQFVKKFPLENNLLYKVAKTLIELWTVTS